MEAENTRGNTVESDIVGGAGQAKAGNTPAADTFQKIGNGSKKISPDPARETVSQESNLQSISRQIPTQFRKQILLLQILQESAANLRDSGISITISTKSRTPDDTALRVEIGGASICDECGWFMLYGLCPNIECNSHKIPKADKADKNFEQKPTKNMAFEQKPSTEREQPSAQKSVEII